ncbi:MAG TPA: fibrinogen-like YCDxxxxGGGW domain-containing protein [Polyangiaceae bacterium]|nr:fibrinogen-like YCDxxxxGGGW domain-containing protein [Polyangiaceae bacterium]
MFVGSPRTALVASLAVLGGCGGRIATTAVPRTSIDASDASDASAGTPGTPAEAPPSSCLEVLHRNPAAASGRYSITVQGNAIEVHCDMALAGGGWTAFFVDRLGSGNVFAHFDSTPALVDDCPDPETRCLRHLPSTIDSNTSFAAECGGDALGFAVNTNVIAYFARGASSRWQPLTGQVALAGRPTLSFGGKMWTGDGSANEGWILSANDFDPSYTTHTFASSYDSVASGWDYCNGVNYNGATGELPMIYLLYR